MPGVELHKTCGELVKLVLYAGLLTNVTDGESVRLFLPLVINEQEARVLAHCDACPILNFD